MLDPILADIFNLIADIAAAVTFAGMVVFVVLYGTFYQWGKRRAGKSVFLLALSMVIVPGISFLAFWVSPDYWLRPFWRMAGWIFSVYAVGSKFSPVRVVRDGSLDVVQPLATAAIRVAAPPRNARRDTPRIASLQSDR